jgi:aminocarboxymuconate-semialdehyde decarboxylase
MKKIGVFNHVWPKPFHDALIDHLGATTDITRRSEAVPMTTDLDRRFGVMDVFGMDDCQILSIASPPCEKHAGPAKAQELATIASDTMAELCQKHPDRFIGISVMSNPDARVEDARRNIEDLGASGKQIFTNVSGKPLDRPEFEDFFDYMHSVGEPIWMHPARGAHFTDYLAEDQSEYEIWWTFGWPYETSTGMARLAFSSHFDRYAGLEIITHHAGGMTPTFEGRVGPGWDQMEARTTNRDLGAVRRALKRPHLEYFKEYHADTATFGSSRPGTHALDLFSEDHVLFASDAPFDPEQGPMYVRETIRIIEELDITEAQWKKIFQDNAVKLLGLDI